MKSFFSGGISEEAEAIKDTAGGDGLFGFVGEEGEFEGDVDVGGIAAHGFGKLVAGGVGVAYFKERVGEIFPRGDFGGVGGEALLEEKDGLVVVFFAKGGIGAVKYRLGSDGCGK